MATNAFRRPGTWFVIAVLAIAALLLLSRACAGSLRLGDLA